jgi:hypothetical protein
VCFRLTHFPWRAHVNHSGALARGLMVRILIAPPGRLASFRALQRWLFPPVSGHNQRLASPAVTASGSHRCLAGSAHFSPPGYAPGEDRRTGAIAAPVCRYDAGGCGPGDSVWPPQATLGYYSR